LLNRAQAFGAAGSADDGIARGGGFQEIIVADAVEAAGIREGGELDAADLLRLGLVRQRDA
jgi:hypothetical protein